MAVTSSTGNPTSTATVWTLDNGDPDLKDITVKVPAAGYTSGLSNFRNISIDTEINADLSAETVLHEFADGDTIMTGGSLDATMTLDAGTYTISGGDISNATFRRTAGDTGTVTLVVTADVVGTGDASLTDVQFQNNLTLELGNVSGGRIDLFDGTNNTPVFSDSDFTADTELTSSDVDYLNTGNVLTAVWSGPGRTDYREEITIAVGNNSLTIDNDALSYPNANTDFTDYSSSESTLITDQLSGSVTAEFDTSAANTSLTVDNLQVNDAAATATNTFDLSVGDFLYFTDGSFQVTTAQTINSATATIIGTLALNDSAVPIQDNAEFRTFATGLHVAIQISADGNLELADGTTNEFMHESGYVRGS